MRRSRSFVLSIGSWLAVGSALALGCGASSANVTPSEAPAPNEPPSATANASATAAATGAEVADTDTAEAAERGDAQPAEATESATDADSSPARTADTGGRNIQYVVSPDGVRVKVEGVTFTPTAEAVRVGKGWGVKVRVEAKAEDDATHSLLAPKSGEIAMAGEVRRSGQSEPERLTDRRDGDHEVLVRPNKPATLTRTWPAKDGPAPLARGDELRLDLGIWGLGADAASRRPVKKLCRVDVKFDREKPRVKISAPEGISK